MWYHLNVNSCREAKTHRSLELASYKCSQIQTPESQSDTVSKINVEIIKKKHMKLSSGIRRKAHTCSYIMTYKNKNTDKHIYTEK